MTAQQKRSEAIKKLKINSAELEKMEASLEEFKEANKVRLEQAAQFRNKSEGICLVATMPVLLLIVCFILSLWTGNVSSAIVSVLVCGVLVFIMLMQKFLLNIFFPEYAKFIAIRKDIVNMKCKIRNLKQEAHGKLTTQ